MSATLQRPTTYEETVDSVLAPVHDRWLEEIRHVTRPAMYAGAGFWDRWTATRYLADQFQDHFRLEQALLASLGGLIPVHDARRLRGQADALNRLLLELDRAGRRRGTGATVAEEARRLIDEVAVWCAELELATSGLRPDQLPLEASQSLDHVLASAAIVFA
ncbi:MAG TPA: hypothetical protein VIG08_16805 [Gemmatimonadales bacterium]